MRSAAWYSGRWSVTSAATTAASVTDGRSSPLAGELGADQHIGPARGEVVVDGLEPPPSRDGIRVETCDPQPRMPGTDLGLDPLGSRAEVADPRAAAPRTAGRDRCGPAVVVAAQLGGGQVVDHRQLAVRAADRLAAVTAHDEGGCAAPVDEQDGLVAVRERGRARRTRRREDGPIALRQLGPHVDDVHHRPSADSPFGQQGSAGLPDADAMDRDHVRRGRGQHEAGTGQLHPTSGRPPGVVAGRAVGLVGPVVGLVQDDEAEIPDRSKDRGSGPDHDTGLAGHHPLPFVVALARREPRVEDGQPIPHRRPQPIGDLRHEGQLRNEDDGSRPTCQGGLHRGQNDIGLARRGHPLEQELAARRKAHDRLECGFLLGRQLIHRGAARGPVGQGVAAHVRPPELHPALRLEPARGVEQAPRRATEPRGKVG